MKRKHKMSLYIELAIDVNISVADGWIESVELLAADKFGRNVKLDPKYIDSDWKLAIEETMDNRDIAAAFRDSDRD